MPAALVLYHLGISTCSQKARLCLAEKALDYVGRPVNLAANEHLEPWYLALNPNGVVPTLTVDGMPVTDSSAICEYLEDAYPNPPLAAPDALDRARMRSWMRYLEEVPTVAIRAPSLNRIFKDAYVGREAEFEMLAQRRPLRRELYRAMGTNGFDEIIIAHSRERLRATLERVETSLNDYGGPWLLGEAFTLADILLIPTVVRMEDLGMTDMWSDLSGFALWYAGVIARPSFAAAFSPGDRLTPVALDGYQEGLSSQLAPATVAVP